MTEPTECCGAYDSQSGCCPFATPQPTQQATPKPEQVTDKEAEHER